MNNIPNSPPKTIYEPIRIFPEEKKGGETERPTPEPSIPYGWEDTKYWTWR